MPVEFLLQGGRAFLPTSPADLMGDELEKKLKDDFKSLAADSKGLALKIAGKTKELGNGARGDLPVFFSLMRCVRTDRLLRIVSCISEPLSFAPTSLLLLMRIGSKSPCLWSSHCLEGLQRIKNKEPVPKGDNKKIVAEQPKPKRNKVFGVPLDPHSRELPLVLAKALEYFQVKGAFWVVLLMIWSMIEDAISCFIFLCFLGVPFFDVRPPDTYDLPGLRHEGLFRLSGSQIAVQNLKERFDNGNVFL